MAAKKLLIWNGKGEQSSVSFAGRNATIQNLQKFLSCNVYQNAEEIVQKIGYSTLQWFSFFSKCLILVIAK